MKSLQEEEKDLLQHESGILTAKLQRRSFLQYAGAGVAGAALIAAGCKKDHNNDNGLSAGVDLGSGDLGILNYAYALEQLEGAFYDTVVKSPYTNISPYELSLLTDIRDHELAHREFFKKALGTNAIQALTVNFASINFTDRTSVLSAAKAFEDLGVSAYNGAGKLIKSADYLLIAGKIVSVEARHAALIRDLLSNGTFADNTVIDVNGLDAARSPLAVLSIAKAYLSTQINASNLPS